MRIIYSRQRTIPSALIRWVTWSRWSHVSVQVSDTLVIDARAWGGVRYRPLSELIDHASEYESDDIALPDEAAAMDWLRSQIGRPYDWGMALGVWWRSSRWHDDARWSCSELVASAFEAGRLMRYRREAWRITPEHLWMVR